MKQWHPIFAELLRPALEKYYEVQTTVPVGDVPREADFVLLRRMTRAAPPFRGLWRHLTTWNALEFKGPSVSPRRRDVDLLIELGLGIDRRLNEERIKQRQRELPAAEVSLWYLANQLGRRFVRLVEQKVGALESLGAGLWRCWVLGHPVFWVSSVDLPVEVDSLPLHVVGREPPETEIQVARLVLERPELQEHYGGWLATLHPSAWKEIEAMARTAGKALKIDVRPAIESLGLRTVLEQVGINRVIEQVGIDCFLETLGKKEVINRIDLDDILTHLTPAKRRELKRRMQ